MSKDAYAVANAEMLLSEILAKQPNMLSQLPSHAAKGKEVGEFIAALRAELIQMYEKVPRA